MRFNFISTLTFEAWDSRTPFGRGIGGSETSHVEMAKRLAARGHEVISYAPISGAGYIEDGVVWASCDDVDFNSPGVWVIYRDPSIIDRIPKTAGQQIWLVCQDVHYKTFTEERQEKVDLVIALCIEHRNYLMARYPKAADKVRISSNGIRSESICENEESLNVNRNQYRMMFASSPDRGLSNAIQIFKRVREVIPQAELHVYYGFNNIEEAMRRNPNLAASGMRKATDQLLKMLSETEGVYHHGRVSQAELYTAWRESAVWLHPSAFQETSCITCMEAQALGAIPVTNPIWAVKQNVQWGVLIDGDPNSSPITRARYINEVIALLLDKERQDEIRYEMMDWARDHFNWERFVSQWEAWAKDRPTLGAVAPPLNATFKRHVHAMGTLAYIGGFMSPPDPFVWSFINAGIYTQEALARDGAFVHVEQSRYGRHDWSRNELAKKTLGDWIVMFDADQQFDPDAAARLVMYAERHKVDVVTGIYCYKTDSSTPVLYMWNEELQTHNTIADFDRSLDLFQVDSAGGGCLFVRRSVFERIWATGQEPFSRIGGFGEDHSFFIRLRTLGIPAYCAWKVQIGHIKFQPVYWDGEAAKAATEWGETKQYEVLASK